MDKMLDLELSMVPFNNVFVCIYARCGETVFCPARRCLFTEVLIGNIVACHRPA